jgi:CheY-like chemotaxis protein
MPLTDTILIVDDSSFIVEGLVAILKKSYRPLAVYGGQQCLDILIKEKPSIIILDIMMEPMDGWETLARIKENPATRNIPVLMFSAKKISAEEADEHRISIDDFVSKPVTPKKLIEAIEKVLARQKSNHARIESWRSAGIGQDRIDEYTSLVTSQVVDMSLLQNMKVQLALVRDDDDKSRSELEAVIAAIDGRIQEEHLREVELTCEMQESIARDAEVKERTIPAPGMDESGQEPLPVMGEAKTPAQPEHMDLQGTADGETNPPDPEVIIPVVSVSHETAIPQMPPIPEAQPPDAGINPQTAGSGSLSEGRVHRESPWADSVVVVTAESLNGEPESDPVLTGLSSPTASPAMKIAPRPLPPETAIENYGTRGNADSDRKTSPAGEQKLPVGHDPRPQVSANPDRKPVTSPGSPIPRAVGSGTDTSSRVSPHPAGKPGGNTVDAKKRKGVAEKDVAASSGGFISRIISAILGIFKRPKK